MIPRAQLAEYEMPHGAAVEVPANQNGGQHIELPPDRLDGNLPVLEQGAVIPPPAPDVEPPRLGNVGMRIPGPRRLEELRRDAALMQQVDGLPPGQLARRRPRALHVVVFGLLAAQPGAAHGGFAGLDARVPRRGLRGRFAPPPPQQAQPHFHPEQQNVHQPANVNLLRGQLEALRRVSPATDAELQYINFDALQAHMEHALTATVHQDPHFWNSVVRRLHVVQSRHDHVRQSIADMCRDGHANRKVRDHEQWNAGQVLYLVMKKIEHNPDPADQQREIRGVLKGLLETEGMCETRHVGEVLAGIGIYAIDFDDARDHMMNISKEILSGPRFHVKRPEEIERADFLAEFDKAMTAFPAFTDEYRTLFKQNNLTDWDTFRGLREAELTSRL